MSYIKTVVNGYIFGLCECNYGEGGISKSEYDYLSEILRNRPASSDSGYVYMLNEDTVEWVKVEFPIEAEPETDIPVEAEATTEIEQKAAAFDYLTGRSAVNE